MRPFLGRPEERARNVAKKENFVLLLVVMGPAVLSAQVLDQVSEKSGSNPKIPIPGSALTCSQLPSIVVPKPLVERPKLQPRLVIPRRESLYADARGIVNIALESEIRKIANS